MTCKGKTIEKPMKIFLIHLGLMLSAVPLFAASKTINHNGKTLKVWTSVPNATANRVTSVATSNKANYNGLYPTASKGALRSDKYRIEVRVPNGAWTNVFAHKTQSLRDSFGGDVTMNYGHFHEQWSHTYGNIEMSDNMPVEVRITYRDSFRINDQDITKINIRPKRDVVYTVAQTGNQALFTINNPGQYTIDINDQMDGSNKALDGEQQYNYKNGRKDTTDIINYAPRHTISLFANPLLTPPPSNGSRTITIQPGTNLRDIDHTTYDTAIFAPGIHDVAYYNPDINIENMPFTDDAAAVAAATPAFPLRPNKHYFIPGDAVVYGCFSNEWDEADVAKNKGTNIRISGYGTISGALLISPRLVYSRSYTIPDPTDPGTTKTYQRDTLSAPWRPITVQAGENVQVIGVTLADPAYHAMNLLPRGGAGSRFAPKTAAKWVKVVGWRGSVDGIGICDLIEDSFIRATDDNSYFRGSRVRCVFWKDSHAAVFHLANTPTNVKIFIEDCDLIYSRSTRIFRRGRPEHYGHDHAVFHLRGGDTVKGVINVDVLVKNFTISDPRPNRVVFNLESRGGKDNQGNGGVGTTYNGIVFENMSIAARPLRAWDDDTNQHTFDIIRGDAGAQWNGGLVFENVTVANSPIKKEDFLRSSGDYVSSLEFAFSTTTPSVNISTTVPSGVTGWVGAWGGGGGGGIASTGTVSSTAFGGGGAGGSFAHIPVVAGATYSCNVGAGGVAGGNGTVTRVRMGGSLVVKAGGGNAGKNALTTTSTPIYGAGGLASSNNTGTAYLGGNGATANMFGSGGSGGSAGWLGSGGSAPAPTSTTAAPGAAGNGEGASGAAGVLITSNGNNGASPGAGGSGAGVKNAGNTTRNGGLGGTGKALISYQYDDW